MDFELCECSFWLVNEMLLKAREAWSGLILQKMQSETCTVPLWTSIDALFFSTSIFNACVCKCVYSLSKTQELAIIIAMSCRALIKKFLWTQIQQTINQSMQMHCEGNLKPSLQLYNFKGTNHAKFFASFVIWVHFRLLVLSKAFRWPMKRRTHKVQSPHLGGRNSFAK